MLSLGLLSWHWLREDRAKLNLKNQKAVVEFLPSGFGARITPENCDSVNVRRDHSRCRWHDGTRLNSPAWWWAEYSCLPPSKRLPSYEQATKLVALVTSLQIDINAAGISATQELATILKVSDLDGLELNDLHVFFGGTTIVARHTSEDSRDRGLRLVCGMRPEFDAAVEREMMLHDLAPTSIRALIKAIIE